jgi:5'-3' exonuclease
MHRVHLVDGTFELFRAFYGAPAARAPDGREVGATRALLRSLLALVQQEKVTHIACAFDTVIESFRNELFAGYKTGEGIEPDLWAQFPLAERAVSALGMVVWSMIEFEADDALATAAARADADPEVEKVVICSPDKDLAQCVRDARVVTLDRIRRIVRDEALVRQRFGVAPASIPDWLALVGDTSDGIPGIPRWGARSASAVLGHYGHLEAIPDDAARWTIKVPGAWQLAASLRDHRSDAVLYRRLATLRTDVPLAGDTHALRWPGAPRQELSAFCREIGEERILERVPRWSDALTA